MKHENVPKSKRLPPPKQLDLSTPLRFSFKYLDLNGNPKFSVSLCRDGYIEKLLGRLRDLCTLSVGEFRSNKSQALKSHRITWHQTTEVGGFASLNEQLRDEEAWQFHITKNEHGRIHGLLLEDTFYIVWVDPDHLLYS